MLPSGSRRLAESNVLIVWPKASASIGVTLASFIGTHSRVESALFTFIGHPVPLAFMRETECVLHSGTGRTTRIALRRERQIPLVSSILDGLLTLLFLTRARRKYDICITAGLNLGLFAILLRGIRVTRRVAFVVMDYWPRKYDSSVLTRLYRYAYGFCCVRADYVIDVAPTIHEVRLRDGIRVDRERQITVPHPIDSRRIGYLPQEELWPDSLVWTGAVTPECGFELVIEAVGLLVSQRPGIVVNVTSYGSFPRHLQQTIRENGLEKHFKILGYIKEEDRFMDVVRRNRVGLSPYNPTITTSSKRYAGVGRPWTYMMNGVPPVITRVPPDVAEIEQAGAGIVIDYDSQQLAQAILKLLLDDGFHETCRQKGLALARGRAMEPVFNELLTRLGLLPDS